MKNKHAKGPDGQPLIAFNSGRGRGRPKKNTLDRQNHVEPTSSFFFRTIDKVGGPIEPTIGFSEIYTEIFIKKKSKTSAEEEKDENDSAKEDADQDDQMAETHKEVDEGEVDGAVAEKGTTKNDGEADPKVEDANDSGKPNTGL